MASDDKTFSAEQEKLKAQPVVKDKNSSRTTEEILEQYNFYNKQNTVVTYGDQVRTFFEANKNKLSADIYPENFFNIENPQSVFVSIDVKTGKDKWIPLIAKQNNFFKSMEINDEGGTKKLNLSLFDKDFVNLESLIATTIAYTQQDMNEEASTKIFNTADALTIVSPIKTGEDSETEDVTLTEMCKDLSDKYISGLSRNSFESQYKNWFEVPKKIKEVIDLFSTMIKQQASSPQELKKNIENYKINVRDILLKIPNFSYLKPEEKILKALYSVGGIEPKRYTFSSDELKKLYETYKKYNEVYAKDLTPETIFIVFSSSINPKGQVFFKLYTKKNDEYVEKVGQKDNIKSLNAEAYDLVKLVLEMKNKELKENRSLDIIFYTNTLLEYNINKIQLELDKIKKYKEDEKNKANSEAAVANERSNLFQLVTGAKDISPNIRIRFGYNDFNEKNRLTDAGYEYEYNELEEEGRVVKTDSKIALVTHGRVTLNMQTTIRSPTFYFLLTGVQSKITREGLLYTLNGFSVSSMILDKFKIVQKFAKLKGTPKEMMSDLMIMFNEKLKNKDENGDLKDSNLNLYLDFDSRLNNKKIEIEEIKEMNVEKKIEEIKEMEIILGSEVSYGKTNMYKSIRSLLNEFCAGCPRKGESKKEIKTNSTYTTYDETGNSTLNNSSTSELDYPQLTYRVIDKTDSKGNLGAQVVFYYKEPRKQKNIRVYTWGMHRNTLVKDLEINNKNEYAALSAFSIFKKDESTLSSTSISQYDVGVTSTNPINTNGILLCNEVDPGGIGATNSARFNNAINSSLKNSLYEGSITIQGDPFYYFDEGMVPYIFAIKINIMRPNSSDGQGAAVSSISSGYYVIKSISHNISTSGFSTTLGVMRYPGLEEQLGISPTYKTLKTSLSNK